MANKKVYQMANPKYKEIIVEKVSYFSRTFSLGSKGHFECKTSEI
jgi:hypothetical protein